jgi:acetylornithine deacetylase
MREDDIQKSIAAFGEGNPGHNYDERWNVYATFEGGSGKSLMFNGHMDTLPAGDESLWLSPPLSPEIKNGKLYGLGVCDMKGGLMASVMAVKLLKDAGISLPGTVFITSVADEEGGGNGSIAAAIQGEKADGVIVCEPTNRELIAATMGFVFFRVAVGGIAVHSGAKWLGVSAIEKCMKLLTALNELEHGWLLRYKHLLLPPPSLNIGTIHGGTAGATVADSCVFETCIHYHSMSHDQVVREFTEAIERACDGDAWLRGHRPEITLYQSGRSYEMDLTHPFADSFKRAFAAVYGHPPTITGSPAGCDSRIWRNIAGCPTLQFGPGSLEQCHSVNEYIELSAYYEAILIYAEMILDWCKAP